MTPVSSDPEHPERLRWITNLLARTLKSEKAFKVLVAVGRVAALVCAIRSCR